MALRQIRQEGDEVLRKTARTVTEYDNKRLNELIDDMFETMNEHNGVGLAAPQVGVLRRVVVIETEEEGKIELINPEIAEVSEETIEEAEACLSLLGKSGIVVRPKKVTVRAYNRHGEAVTVTGEDLLAKALCHEIDHLDGILYTDKVIRMCDPDEEEQEEKKREQRRVRRNDQKRG
ncbi:peptide deformylase [Clostridia bacterium]|nr:peptide deformylase [Clostridia bacterium]